MHQFQDLIPDRYLWVSVDGRDSNDGSRDAPFGSIQAAIEAATPGTAVLVTAGTYQENVKVTSSGTEQKPIWIVSADGEHEATIVPQIETTSTVYGRGTDNVVISGFRVDGAEGQHAIEFTQAGHTYHNWVNNVVIENNQIFSTGLDGIKLAQARHVEVIGNTIDGGAEESIDLVTVFDSVIYGNEINGLDGRSGITVKGGSERITIEKNSIKDVGADAITVGGWTDQSLLTELSLEFQAKDVLVKDNFIQGVEKRAINILGGEDATIEGNYIEPNNDYPASVNIQSGRWGLSSKNVTIEDNIILDENWLRVNQGQGEGLVVQNNRQSGTWDQDVGLDAIDGFSLTWLESETPAPAPEPTPPPAPAPDEPGSDLVSEEQINRLFDGVDDHHIIQHSDDWALDSGTIGFRFEADDVDGLQGLFSKDAKFFGDGGHLSVWLDGERVVARLQSQDGSYTLRSEPGSVAPNTDTHLALTFGDDGFKLYLDGTLVDMDDYDGGMAPNGEPIVLGGRAIYSSDNSADVVTDHFKGTIGDVDVHDTALDAEAIATLSGRLAPVAEQPTPVPAPDPTPEPTPPPADPAPDLVSSWQIDRLFDGVDDHHVIEHSDVWALNAGTISLNFEAADVNGLQGLFSKDAKFFGDGGHLSVWLDGERVVARLQSQDGSYTLRSEPGSVAPNTDTHLALTFGDDGFKLYLDGTLVDMDDYDGGMAPNGEPIVLAGRAVYSSDNSADVVTDHFKGTISNVSVHDTALDAEAIAALSGRLDPVADQPASPPASPSAEPESDLVSSWQIDRLFDGVDDRRIIEHSDDFRIEDGSITLSFTPDDTLGIQGLVSKDAKHFGDGGHFTMYLQGERLFARLQDQGTSHTVSSGPGSIKAGKETVASIEFGAEGMRLFLDGELVDTNAYMGGIESNGEDMVVGASAMYSQAGENNALTHFFDGTIDDLTIEDHGSRWDPSETLA